jgi:hypothetical protein
VDVESAIKNNLSHSPEQEPRWHASLAVIASIVLYVTLPARLTLGPVWLFPVLVLVILVPLSILAPIRRAETRKVRFASILLIAIVNFFNITSIALLLHAFFHPQKVEPTAGLLLRHGVQIWLTNILVFALWYWELDGDGPDARAHKPTALDFHGADFLFPQVQLMIAGSDTPRCIDRRWKPLFLDYLYVSFTCSTAFSPTDTMPLSRMAKMLMTVEAFISLVTIAVVLARAVSLLQ